jgi:dTDP-4-dehydrorhamnose 3,5-epimerase
MNALEATPCRLAGLLLIENRVFTDSRGYFMELYHARKYASAGLTKPFVQDNCSFSRCGVVRGLHYQLGRPQGKLVFVLSGTIHDVAVDIRRGSPTFGQWESYVLSSENRRQLYVPEGFAHGFVVTSETALVMYKCTDLYHPSDERGILWNDPDLGIDWPDVTPIVSDKDAILPRLGAAPSDDLPIFDG